METSTNSLIVELANPLLKASWKSTGSGRQATGSTRGALYDEEAKTLAKAVRTGLAATLAASMLTVCLPHQYVLAASISVDGSSSDWSGISTEAGTTGQVSK